MTKILIVCLLLVLLPIIIYADVDVEPKVVGSASTDSVIITITTIDTTYYPTVANADSLIILVYPPDNDVPESTANGGTGVLNRTTGYYEYHRRGSNATPDLGIYRVVVKAWKGGATRGIAGCTYTVTGAGTYYYTVIDSARDNTVALIDSARKIDTTLIVARVNIDSTKAKAFAIKAKTDSSSYSAGGYAKTNVIQINSQSTSASNLNLLLDGDTTWGTNPIMSIERVFIRPEAGNTDAICAEGLGTGHGIRGVGGAGGGDGIKGTGGASAGNGIRGVGGTGGNGMYVSGSYGLRAVGITHDILLAGSGHMVGWVDSVVYINNVSAQVNAIQAYFGAGDGWRQWLMPFGQSNKDSIRTFVGDSLVSTIYLWKNISTPTILDSIREEIW